MKIYGRTLLVIWLLAGLLTAAYGGAWPQKKGGYYLKLAGSYISTGQEFDNLGKRKDILQDLEVFENARYTEFSINAYLEYGLTNRLTVVADLPFKFANSERREISNYFPGGFRDVSFSSSGLGDLRLSGRLGLLGSPLVLSAQYGFKWPLGYKRSGEIEGPALGNSETEHSLELLIGRSLYPFPAYLTGSVGYRTRGGGLHDEVIYAIEGGLTRGGLLLKLSFSGVSNTIDAFPDIYGRTIQLPLPGGGGVVPDRLFGDQNYQKLNIGLTVALKDALALDGQVFHTLNGRNTITATLFQLGIVMQR